MRTLHHRIMAHIPKSKTEMLIRRPVNEVFQAFIDPEVTTKFWFTKGSAKLQTGKQVKWDWEMYNVSAIVKVKEVDENKRILVEWQGLHNPTTVEWIFTPYGEDATFVSVTESGFGGEGDEIIKSALDSISGFTWVLAGLKAWLEYGVQLNLVADHHPKKA